MGGRREEPCPSELHAIDVDQQLRDVMHALRGHPRVEERNGAYVVTERMPES